MSQVKMYSAHMGQEWPTLEAIHVGRCCGIRVLEFDRLSNLLSLEFGIDCRSSEKDEDSLCILILTLAYQPPRGLGCKGKAEQKDDRENPLESTENKIDEGIDTEDTLLTMEVCMRRQWSSYRFPE